MGRCNLTLSLGDGAEVTAHEDYAMFFESLLTAEARAGRDGAKTPTSLHEPRCFAHFCSDSLTNGGSRDFVGGAVSGAASQARARLGHKMYDRLVRGCIEHLGKLDLELVDINDESEVEELHGAADAGADGSGGVGKGSFTPSNPTDYRCGAADPPPAPPPQPSAAPPSDPPAVPLIAPQPPLLLLCH